MPNGQKGMIQEHAGAGEFHNLPDLTFLWFSITWGSAVLAAGLVFNIMASMELFSGVVQ
jgi:hypothetical protein